jgi:hypothetical protein
MKSEQKIRQKLKQLKFRALKRRLEDLLKKRPCNCIFNEEFTAGSKKIGLCRWSRILPDDQWGSVTCDDDSEEGWDQAEVCPKFTLPKTKDEIKKDFKDFLQKPMGEIAYWEPSLAAILWVLDLENSTDEDLDDDSSPEI